MRISICLVTICISITIKRIWFVNRSLRSASQLPTEVLTAREGNSGRNGQHAGAPTGGSLVPSAESYVVEQGRPLFATGAYRGIAQRNIFGLVPVSSINLPVVVNDEPKQDLVLNGISDIGGIRCALFQVLEPGKPSFSFTLQEGEQNEWMQIRAVDAKNGTVTAILKRAVMRIHNSDVQVIFSLEANGTRR